MQIKTKHDVDCRAKAGSGNVLGKIGGGKIFTVLNDSNGWYEINRGDRNVWMQASACDVVTVEPPPVEPPPVMAAYPDRFQIRFPDGQGGWQPYQGYAKND